MVNNLVQIKKIDKGDSFLISSFLHHAGNSLTTFRYFDKRPLSSIDNHVITAIILDNNTPVGYGHLDNEGDRTWLGIAIAEMSTGKGLGKLMMSFLISSADELGLPLISLSVDKDNDKAITLYEKFGFNCIREINIKSQLMERKCQSTC